MHNFITVFVHLKIFSAESDSSSPLKLEEIENKIPINSQIMKVHQYLEVLEDLGYVKYSRKRKTIMLTSKGKNSETLFTIDPN